MTYTSIAFMSSNRAVSREDISNQLSSDTHFPPSNLKPIYAQYRLSGVYIYTIQWH